MRFNGELIKKDMHNAFPVLIFITVFIVGSNFALGKICAFRIIAGIPCPGCGLTRAFILLLQGNIKEATEMHPFWAPVLALFFAFVLCRYFIVNKEKRKKAAHIIWIMAIVMIICMFIFYLYRMIVYYPDVEPMVYDEKNIVNVIRMLPGIV